MFSAFTDGACRVSNPGLCSSAFVVYEGDEEVHRFGRLLPGLNTNNVAEYSALLDLLDWAAQESIHGIHVYSDSKLVVNQVNLEWACKTEALAQLCLRAHMLLIRGRHSITHIRGHSGDLGNETADAICNQILDEAQACG